VAGAGVASGAGGRSIEVAKYQKLQDGKVDGRRLDESLVPNGSCAILLMRKQRSQVLSASFRMTTRGTRQMVHKLSGWPI